MTLAQFRIYSPSLIFALCRYLNVIVIVIVFQKIAPVVTNRLFLHILAGAFKKKIFVRAPFLKNTTTRCITINRLTCFSSRESKEASTIKWASFNWVLNMVSDKMYLQKVITKNQTPKCVSIFPRSNQEWASVTQNSFYSYFHSL